MPAPSLSVSLFVVSDPWPAIGAAIEHRAFAERVQSIENDRRPRRNPHQIGCCFAEACAFARRAFCKRSVETRTKRLDRRFGAVVQLNVQPIGTRGGSASSVSRRPRCRRHALLAPPVQPAARALRVGHILAPSPAPGLVRSACGRHHPPRLHQRPQMPTAFARARRQ